LAKRVNGPSVPMNPVWSVLIPSAPPPQRRT
jgi:hypothetical protein